MVIYFRLLLGRQILSELPIFVKGLTFITSARMAAFNASFKLSIGSQLAKGTLERTCGTRSCSPPPGGGCGLRPFLAEPQMKNSKLRIKNGLLHPKLIRFRATACEAPARADAKCGPSRGEAAARCGSFWNRKFKIQNSKLKLLLGLQPAEDACDAKEQRASAAGRLRPADLFEVEHPA